MCHCKTFTIFTTREKTLTALQDILPIPAHISSDDVSHIAECTGIIRDWLFTAWQKGLLSFSEYYEMRDAVK